MRITLLGTVRKCIKRVTTNGNRESVYFWDTYMYIYIHANILREKVRRNRQLTNFGEWSCWCVSGICHKFFLNSILAAHSLSLFSR